MSVEAIESREKMTRHRVTTLVMVVLSVVVVSAYPSFMKKIPNADKVINPISGKKHPGVGHILEGGKGERNCFGKDFDEVKYKWTKELCSKDSDGDGKSNGEELGDPKCMWSVEAPGHLDIKPKITHPGVCTPVDSDVCKIFNSPNSTCTLPQDRSAGHSNQRVTTIEMLAYITIFIHSFISSSCNYF